MVGVRLMMEVVAVVRCMTVVVVQLDALVMGFVGAKMWKDGGAFGSAAQAMRAKSTHASSTLGW